MQFESGFRSSYCVERHIYSPCMGKAIPQPTVLLGPFPSRWPGEDSIYHWEVQRCRAHAGKWRQEQTFLFLASDLFSQWPLSDGRQGVSSVVSPESWLAILRKVTGDGLSGIEPFSTKISPSAVYLCSDSLNLPKGFLIAKFWA